jgi:hypothetical protein
MFDFRYHAISLVAVFLALMIGLLLGVAIGDKGLVSSAERNVRQSLRGDVRAAEARSAGLIAQLAVQKRFQDAVYPLLVENRLAGQQIGLVGLGGLPDDTIRAVRDALAGSGGQLAGVAVIREPVGAAATAFVPNAANPPANGDFIKLGRMLGVALVRGGRRERALERALLVSSSGRLGGLQGVVVFRARAVGAQEDPATNAFENGFVRGLGAGNSQVVGAETTTTIPSQILWFHTRGLGSVDDLDQIAGKGALVFALAGANGSYGIKGSAQALLPGAVGGNGG